MLFLYAMLPEQTTLVPVLTYHRVVRSSDRRRRGASRRVLLHSDLNADTRSAEFSIQSELHFEIIYEPEEGTPQEQAESITDARLSILSSLARIVNDEDLHSSQPYLLNLNGIPLEGLLSLKDAIDHPRRHPDTTIPKGIYIQPIYPGMLALDCLTILSRYRPNITFLDDVRAAVVLPAITKSKPPLPYRLLLIGPTDDCWLHLDLLILHMHTVGLGDGLCSRVSQVTGYAVHLELFDMFETYYNDADRTRNPPPIQVPPKKNSKSRKKPIPSHADPSGVPLPSRTIVPVSRGSFAQALRNDLPTETNLTKYISEPDFSDLVTRIVTTQLQERDGLLAARLDDLQNQRNADAKLNTERSILDKEGRFADKLADYMKDVRQLASKNRELLSYASQNQTTDMHHRFKDSLQSTVDDLTATIQTQQTILTRMHKSLLAEALLHGVILYDTPDRLDFLHGQARVP